MKHRLRRVIHKKNKWLALIERILQGQMSKKNKFKFNKPYQDNALQS